MGVKGLQSFLEYCCPEACVTVNLREMARQHVSPQGSTPAPNRNSPTLVVDAMGCLRHWYSCKDWVSGGQWKEYMGNLKSWVEAFTSAGIRLVFFFDGVVEEQKRVSWVKRRSRVNGDICKIFSHIKTFGEQPRRELFVLPSGLATFTIFGLKLLGQEVFCSVREADFEIACFAREHNCMGILGQDTDFIIFDSAPYLSVTKLRTDSLTTVLYDRHRFCEAVGLTLHQLPLLACLLGNDVVSGERMQHIRKNALTTYRQINSIPHSGSQQGQMVFAVSQFVSSLSGSHGDSSLIPSSLKLSPSEKELLSTGIQSYLLPQQIGEKTDHPVTCAYEKFVSPDISKACREKHIAAEGFMVYSVVSEGVVECSNSLEDEQDTDLLPQALVYKLCRQKIYGLLLLQSHDGSIENPPPIKEWIVYPGNSLKGPEMVPPIPANPKCGLPNIDLLWFGSGQEVSIQRLACFLDIFDCQDFSELYEEIEEHLFASVCLVTYIVIQVQTLSQEDVDAYLSQAVLLAQKSPQELQHIQLPFLCSRVVQLGSLYVRGLSYLLGANSACGSPLTTNALMPWSSFDGRLFHSKYLLAHNNTEDTALLENDPSCLDVFHHLKAKVRDTCLKRGRVLQSSPRRDTTPIHEKTPAEPRYRHTGGGDWRGAEGWKGRGEERRQHYHDRGLTRGRFNHKGRYHLAPRWSHPPAP